MAAFLIGKLIKKICSIAVKGWNYDDHRQLRELSRLCRIEPTMRSTVAFLLIKSGAFFADAHRANILYGANTVCCCWCIKTDMTCYMSGQSVLQYAMQSSFCQPSFQWGKCHNKLNISHTICLVMQDHTERKSVIRFQQKCYTLISVLPPTGDVSIIGRCMWCQQATRK